MISPEERHIIESCSREEIESLKCIIEEVTDPMERYSIMSIVYTPGEIGHEIMRIHSSFDLGFILKRP